MLFRSYQNPASSELYQAVVDCARAPALFADLGVPDTVAGRFEMVVLHLFLVLERLYASPPAGVAVGQRLFDAFLDDARSRGAVLVKWQVLDWNQPAIEFYEHHGARLDGEWINCHLESGQISELLRSKD